MTVFVVVSFKRGNSGSLYVEAKGVFKTRGPALELADKLNGDDASDAWSFVSETEMHDA